MNIMYINCPPTMVQRKGSRVASRAKPVLPDKSQTEAKMNDEKREQKIKLLLKDFDFEVEKRVKKMEAEIQIIEDAIQQVFKMDLVCYSEETRNMLWSDYIQQKERKSSNPLKDSVIDIISSADGVLQLAVKKRGRKRKLQQKENDNAAFMPPSTVTRTTRSNRQRLARDQNENMPPPSTRPQHTKKPEPAATPMNSNLTADSSSHLFVTPKFDPRTPLPTGTIKRKPLLGEVAISLQGSPLQVSPSPILPESVEEWMARLDADNLDESMKSKLIKIHHTVRNVLKI